MLSTKLFRETTALSDAHESALIPAKSSGNAIQGFATKRREATFGPLAALANNTGIIDFGGIGSESPIRTPITASI
ncbi:hypothetical protein ACFWPX_16440 [Nocardia sp. NPDC058518]|uniref:hypothetical protein n=1 Tax=Nocardia sp. NPDC058518 TaxID=3346534 RepID=UPI00364DFD33